MPHSAPAFTSTNPPELRNLLHHNHGWAHSMRVKDSKFFKRLADKPAPKVLWFGCSDSRVPESVILDAKPGVVFTHRNIANQFHLDDDSALSALTYALEELDVQHIVVCGHTKCGGVKGAFQAASASVAKAKPHDHDHSQHDHHTHVHIDKSTPLKRWLAPLVKLAIAQDIPKMGEKAGIPQLAIESVKQQVSNIASTSIVKQVANSKRRSITIHGWMYDIETGEIADMHVSVLVPAVGVTYYGRLLDNLRQHSSTPPSPISSNYSSIYRLRSRNKKDGLVM